MPPPPDAEFDPYLDAFARVVVRHGLSRARVQDVADDLGINRVTVYRQVGTVKDMTRLLLAREVHRAMPNTIRWAEADDPIDALIELLVDIVRLARGHRVLAKIITDEPQLLGPILVRELPTILGQSARLGAALFQVAIDRGRIARRDPRQLGDWVARILLTAVLAPPPGSLRSFFDAGLRPLLEPRPAG